MKGQQYYETKEDIEQNFIYKKNLFSRIFNPEDFNPSDGIEEIEQSGGLTSLMHELKVSHRQGLSCFTKDENALRIKVFGENIPPKGQNVLKSSLAAESDFTISLLLYIITLRFCVKMLLIRDGLNVESILDECISVFLLLVMLLLKAMVNIEFQKMDQNQRKYLDESWIKVRKDGEVVEVLEKTIMVGDITIVEAEDVIRFDGILLSARNLSINQSQTILRQDTKVKNSYLDYKNIDTQLHSEQFDPFILAGSSVVYGKGEVLVCQIGEQCSFRVKNEKIEAYLESTPIISQLKRVFNILETFSKMLAFCCSTLFSIYYLNKAIEDENLSWFTFLYILKTYSSFIGFVCLLQRLKIIRSLQFFLESYRSDMHFMIKNKATLQSLSQSDLIIIQKEALYIFETDRGFQMPKIDFLAYLNRYFNVKVVSSRTKQEIQEQFNLLQFDQSSGNIESMIGPAKFYKENTNEYSELKLEQLKECFFITETNRKKLVDDLLPIFQSLEYRITYISKFKAFTPSQLPKNIISITFSEEIYEMEKAERQGALDCWVRIKNTPIIQDHFQTILEKSFIFAQLYNVYMKQFVNNVGIFLLMCWISIIRDFSIDFYWSLIVIIIARYNFFRIYQTIVVDRSESVCFQKCSNKEILKYNILLLPYYVYCLGQLEEKINIVIFFLCNSLLRTDVLLMKVQWKFALKQYLINNLLALGITAGNIAWNWFHYDPIDEETELFTFAVGLSALFLVYGMFIN